MRSDSNVKYCSRCRKIRPTRDFSKSNRGLNSWCRSCMADYYRERVRRDPDYKARRQRDAADYYRRNRQRYIRRAIAWQRDHPVEVKTRCWRRHQDPLYRMDKNLLRAMRKAIRLQGEYDGGRNFEILGFTPTRLYRQVLGFMNKPCCVCGERIVTLATGALSRKRGWYTVKTAADVVAINSLDNVRLVCRSCAFANNGGRGSRHVVSSSGVK